MARAITPLTNTKIKTAKAKEKVYKLSDGGGLYLSVTTAGGKNWKLRFTLNSKEQTISLGKYPHITLQKARELTEQHKRDIANGLNPNEQKQIKKEILKEEEIINLNTFEKLARERLLKVQDEISEGHYNRTLKALINDCFPIIGKMPINDVTAKDILVILHKMADRGAKESGRKLFYSIGKTFKWAVANDKAERNPAGDILLEEVLGKKTKKHYPTITDCQVSPRCTISKAKS